MWKIILVVVVILFFIQYMWNRQGYFDYQLKPYYLSLWNIFNLTTRPGKFQDSNTVRFGAKPIII